ncbi:unnamed protein product [Cyprideis torosa]|uniref:Uncharacterized protein n=1 Tax=Cyprideis torosa TaxID=163714 RepID=A0A7R8ZP56_9CRUS|nr:unnamed protein product [Cyprideis torosa]CAG0898002.1 unnamed protein product [Cyprideis torosa]
MMSRRHFCNVLQSPRKTRWLLLVVSVLTVFFLIAWNLLRPVKFIPLPPVALDDPLQLPSMPGDVSIAVCRPTPVDFSPLEKFLVKSSPKVCPGKLPWFQVTGDKIRITDEALLRNAGSVECTFTEWHYVSDLVVRNSPPVSTTAGEYTLKDSDVAKVSCTGAHGLKYESVEIGVARSKRDGIGWSYTADDDIGLSILILVYDSVSRGIFERKLPKTNSILRSLGAITLEGYSILGDGTPAALIPMLTGETEEELPGVQKNLKKPLSVSTYPFIFQEAMDRGYVTAYLEDTWRVGTFTYRLTGFAYPPTDHFPIPYFKAMEQGEAAWNFCREGKVHHLDWLEYITNLMDTYTSVPRLFFGLHGHLSHDDLNRLGEHDDELVDFFADLEAQGHLNNSLVLLMADHGPRFTEFRQTEGGNHEERHPFIRMLLPCWFAQKFPEKHENLMENARSGVLLTPFDLHATFLDLLGDGLLDERREVWRSKGLKTADTRALSLFSEIPKDRDCKVADIPVHWCDCFKWTLLSVEDPSVRHIADTIVESINRFNSVAGRLCSRLTIREIAQASSTFNDGHLLFEVHFSVSPSGAKFEALAAKVLNSSHVAVDVPTISRTNRYEDQPRCISGSFPQLLKFCYCETDPF